MDELKQPPMLLNKSLYPDDDISDDGTPEVGLGLDGKFTSGNPATDELPSRLPATHLNLLTDLLDDTIKSSLGESNNQDNTQLTRAINAVLDSRTIGRIELLPFRLAYIPKGWYVCNGDRFLLDSPVGEALQNLESYYKGAWKIKENEGYINVPDFFSYGGRGYFIRPVIGFNAGGTIVGGTEAPGLPNITGSISNKSIYGTFMTIGDVKGKGALKVEYVRKGAQPYTGGNQNHNVSFDASLSNSIYGSSNEVSPRNIGMIAAIYLAV